METQKISFDSHSSCKLSESQGVFDMETQALVQQESSVDMTTRDDKTYDHTKGSQKMEIDDTLEQARNAATIFEQPTQATIMKDADDDDDDDDYDCQSNESEDLLAGDDDFIMDPDDERIQENANVQDVEDGKETVAESPSRDTDDVFEAATQLNDVVQDGCKETVAESPSKDTDDNNDVMDEDNDDVEDNSRNGPIKDSLETATRLSNEFIENNPDETDDAFEAATQLNNDLHDAEDGKETVAESPSEDTDDNDEDDVFDAATQHNVSAENVKETVAESPINEADDGGGQSDDDQDNRGDDTNNLNVDNAIEDGDESDTSSIDLIASSQEETPSMSLSTRYLSLPPKKNASSLPKVVRRSKSPSKHEEDEDVQPDQPTQDSQDSQDSQDFQPVFQRKPNQDHDQDHEMSDIENSEELLGSTQFLADDSKIEDIDLDKDLDDKDPDDKDLDDNDFDEDDDDEPIEHAREEPKKSEDPFKYDPELSFNLEEPATVCIDELVKTRMASNDDDEIPDIDEEDQIDQEAVNENLEKEASKKESEIDDIDQLDQANQPTQDFQESQPNIQSANVDIMDEEVAAETENVAEPNVRKSQRDTKSKEAGIVNKSGRRGRKSVKQDPVKNRQKTEKGDVCNTEQTGNESQFIIQPANVAIRDDAVVAEETLEVENVEESNVRKSSRQRRPSAKILAVSKEASNETRKSSRPKRSAPKSDETLTKRPKRTSSPVQAKTSSRRSVAETKTEKNQSSKEDENGAKEKGNEDEETGNDDEESVKVKTGGRRNRKSANPVVANVEPEPVKNRSRRQKTEKDDGSYTKPSGSDTKSTGNEDKEAGIVNKGGRRGRKSATPVLANVKPEPVKNRSRRQKTEKEDGSDTEQTGNEDKDEVGTHIQKSTNPYIVPEPEPEKNPRSSRRSTRQVPPKSEPLTETRTSRRSTKVQQEPPSKVNKNVQVKIEKLELPTSILSNTKTVKKEPIKERASRRKTNLEVVKEEPTDHPTPSKKAKTDSEENIRPSTSRSKRPSIALVTPQPSPPKRSRKSSALTVKKETSTERSPALASSSRKKSKPAVMFTGYEDPQDVKLVKDMGGVLTTQVTDCTVLVTDKLRRTAKLLCILGRGVPIVTPAWLSQSKMTKTFLGNNFNFQLKNGQF
jgi:hypothetical protein